MTRIEHVALWTRDVARLADFYASYLGGVVGAEYRNPAKGFSSRFVRFADGARLEIMSTTQQSPVSVAAGAERFGLTHLAFSAGSEPAVDELCARLARDGFEVLDGPRRTGDGYYECVVLDPDGNRLEVTA